jgi:hypothetical protein
MLNTHDCAAHRRPNRTVRFQSTECTLVVYSNDTNTTSEEERKSSQWYKVADIRKFQSNNESLIRKYRALVRSRQRLDRRDVSTNERVVSTTMEIEEEMRGLEDNFSILSQLLHKRRLAESYRGVLNEQLRQKNLWNQGGHANKPFFLDSDMIRKVSVNNSMKSKIIGEKLGEEDAAFVWKLKNNTQLCKGSFIQNNKHVNKIDCKQPERKSTFRKADASMSMVQNTCSKKAKGTGSSLIRKSQISYIAAIHSTCSVRLTI